MAEQALALLANEVHVWTAWLGAGTALDADALLTLSTGEVDRANRFHREEDRDHFVQRRILLREIIGAYSHTAPGDLEFTTNRHGCPAVVFPVTAATISFSSSHSDALAVIAIARGQTLGVDVERIHGQSLEEIAEVTARFFTARESAAIAHLGAAERARAFFATWARKEAITKALGRGLSIPLNAFDVSVTPGEGGAILRWDAEWERMGDLRLHELALADGYAACLAVEHRAMVRLRGDWLRAR